MLNSTLASLPDGEWVDLTAEAGVSVRWYAYRFGHHAVTLVERPHYCDRGHWVGNVLGPELYIDHQDGFPRYFMDLERAQTEMVDWLKWRLQRAGICHKNGNAEKP